MRDLCITLIRTKFASQKQTETFEKCSILVRVKEGENLNHRNILNISRIDPAIGGIEPDAEIGQKGAFCKGLRLSLTYILL